MKKFFVFTTLAIIFLSFTLFFQAQAQETLTIATYYPSPSGVYQSLRLFPSAQATQPVCDNAHPNSEGTLYFDNAQNQLQLCSTTAGQRGWGPLSGLWTRGGVTPNQFIYPNDTAWNVGIGTQNPTDRLTIENNNTNVVGLRLRSQGMGFGSGVFFENYTPSTGRTFSIYSSSAGYLVIGDETASTARMLIDQNGIVIVNRFVIQKRAADPTSPNEGEIWLRQ